jgi:hypothetical protein
MRQTLLVSVAALALAAGSTVALSQGGPGGGSPGAAGGAAGGNAPMANPSGPGGGAGAPGGAMSRDSQSTIDGKQQRGAQERSGQSGKPQRSTEGRDQDRMQNQDRMQKSTQGKDQPATQQRQTQSPAQPGAKQQGQAQQNGTGKGQAQTGTQPGTKGAMTTSNVSLTSEQKTVIRSKVLTGSAPRVTNVNFDIRVGTVVPRTVRVAPVPVTLVEIEPRWRGYMYFVYSDEIIIVEPRSLKIVAVLEV